MADLIYNQTKIPKEKWRYGLRASAKTGCGWIAVYNALVLLGEAPKPEALIAALERQFPPLQGTFGTLCLGPAMLLKKMGYAVYPCSDTERFDELCQNSSVAILFYYWRKGIRINAHFVTVEYRDGQFIGYNTYSDSQGPDAYGDSLPAFLKRQGYFGTVLTAIKGAKTFLAP